MTLKFAAAALLAATAFAVPAAAQTVGSASYATQRGCGTATAAQACDGAGAGQFIANSAWGGGTGLAGWNTLTVGANRAWSFVAFDAGFDLPTIRAATEAPGNVRMNINTFAFQSYTWTGAVGGDFSISGDLHIVGSSVSQPDIPDYFGPGDDLLGGVFPGGAIYTAYAGIWDPGIITGLSTPQELFSALFYAPCGTAGVMGAQLIGGSLTGGEATYTATTQACSPGSLFLTPGQEVLVVVGLQLPVNRGGWADSSATFVTGFGKDLTPEQLAVVEQSVSSAISQGASVASVPEPASWAMLIAGFGLTGAAMRRRNIGLTRVAA
jgi:hypothetical protein